MSLRVLLVGSGGREHALAWKLKQSPLLEQLFVAPGNPGTALVATNLNIQTDDIDGLVQWAADHWIDVVVVGPERPLAAGLVDRLQARAIPVFGPTQAAAAIESSKSFAKQLMLAEGIPTARWLATRSPIQTMSAAESFGGPVVIKQDGLADGKGVFPCPTLDDVEQAICHCVDQRLYDSGPVVVEELLTGHEYSLHALSGGKTYLMFPPVVDYKRLSPDPGSPNTGGMGCFGAIPWDHPDLIRIVDQAVRPALLGMAKRDRVFTGCLYPGMMRGAKDDWVLEYNGRFGDPETQVYCRLLDSDLLELVRATVEDRLDEFTPTWSRAVAICVVLCSAGYPGQYQTGHEISGLDQASLVPGVQVFHAGTKLEQGNLVTNGGRVINVTATGTTINQARDRAYEAVTRIHFSGMHYRQDIGQHSHFIL